MLEELSEEERRDRLRVYGKRSPEPLPDIDKANFDKFLWEETAKSEWSLEQAAYYLLYKNPNNYIDTESKNLVERVYKWLVEHYAEDENKSHEEIKAIPRSPGNIIRYEWENWRPLDMRIWALYHHRDQNSHPLKTAPHKRQKLFQDAANIIWDEYNFISIDEMASFLHKHKKLIDKSPKSLSRETIRRHYLQGMGRLDFNAPMKEMKQNPEDHESHLIEIICKKLGH